MFVLLLAWIGKLQMPYEMKVIHGKELPWIWSEIDSFCIFCCLKTAFC